MNYNPNIPLAHPVRQTCYRIGVGRSKLFQMIKAGEIVPFKVGRKLLFTEAELNRFIAARATGSRGSK